MPTSRYTADERPAMIARGEDRTDTARVLAMTEEELEAAIASDPDWKNIPEDWYRDAIPVHPAEPKQRLSPRLDTAIITWFRQQDPGYQTRMNAVLRAYMHHAGR